MVDSLREGLRLAKEEVWYWGTSFDFEVYFFSKREHRRMIVCIANSAHVLFFSIGCDVSMDMESTASYSEPFFKKPHFKLKKGTTAIRGYREFIMAW